MASPLSPAPVVIDATRVRRTVVGLRPFRPDGFRVAAEPLGGKVLVHNYGHGGSGVTLSWGTARQAADLACVGDPGPVAVIGCGVIGLSTARVLQARGAQVTIYAAALPPDTTSNVPGAFWLPVAVCEPGRMTSDLAQQLAGALRESRRMFETLLTGQRYGVRSLPQFYIDREPPTLSPFMAVAPELFEGATLSPGHHPFGERHVMLMQGLVIDTTRYIRALDEDFRAAGGAVVVRELRDREMLATLPERVIVNCAGLGAGALADDPSMIPIKGQLLLMEPQPGVDHILIAPREGLYMVPRSDAIVLGTSKEPGVRTMEPNPAESARILAGIQDLW